MPSRLEIPVETLWRLYCEEGLSQQQIARRFGCNAKTISNRLKEYHLPTRTAGDYTRLPIDQEELDRLYNHEKLSLKAIACRFGCSVAAIQNALARYHIPTRPPGWNSIRQYVPDRMLLRWSSELAYAVGLIASDGYLDRDYNCVGFTSIDLELVKLYCQCLRLGDKVRIKKIQTPVGKPQYTVKFSDPGYRLFLERIGLTPAKSRTLGPLQIPDDFFRDFLRGCWDGDGTWYIHHRAAREYLYAQLSSGSPAFLSWVQNTVKRLTGLKGSLSRRLLLRYGGSKAIELGYWIYYSSSLPCLQRKRAIWEHFARVNAGGACRKPLYEYGKKLLRR